MTTHLVFTVFGLMTNILVTAMLLTGGSAAFNALTGKQIGILLLQASTNIDRRSNPGGLLLAPSRCYHLHYVSLLTFLGRSVTITDCHPLGSEVSRQRF
jgi:hypothetical protein